MRNLLQPLTIKNITLQNRLIMPPLATEKSSAEGKVSKALLDFYKEKSEGGLVSLFIIEHSYVRKDGKASAYQLSVAENSDVSGLKELSAAIHRNGSKAVMQINHAGSAASADITGSQPVGPSAAANPRKGGTPRALTQQEISGIVTAFADAARRVKEAGFDGVEIHSAHGYLLNQFYSPLTNKRVDAYGGDVFGRIQIHLEVIAAARKAVGEDYPILLRLGASDYAQGGSTIMDSQAAAKAFEQAGVNVIDVSGGFCGYTVPGNDGYGYFSPLSFAIKEAIALPVILTGGITKAQEAEDLLLRGAADLIGVGRAILKDSQWAKKELSGLIRTEGIHFQQFLQ